LNSDVAAYRILYYLYTKARRDHKALLKSLTVEELNDPRIQFALDARSASMNNDTFKFFELYYLAEKELIQLGYVLLEQIIDRERVKGLHALFKSHQQSLSVSNAALHLGFCYEYYHEIEEVQQGDSKFKDIHQLDTPKIRVLKFVNRVITKVLEEIPSAPQNPQPYLVPESDDFDNFIKPKANLSKFMESYLTYFTKVRSVGDAFLIGCSWINEPLKFILGMLTRSTLPTFVSMLFLLVLFVFRWTLKDKLDPWSPTIWRNRNNKNLLEAVSFIFVFIESHVARSGCYAISKEAQHGFLPVGGLTISTQVYFTTVSLPFLQLSYFILFGIH
jgi:hypothetical protein